MSGEGAESFKGVLPILAFRVWLKQRKPEDLSPALNQRILVLFQRPTGLAVGLGLKETAPPAPAGHTPSYWFPRSRVRDLAGHIWHHEYLVSSILGTSRPVNSAGTMVCCQPESFTLEYLLALGTWAALPRNCADTDRCVWGTLL